MATYDLAIVGGGIGGSALATVMALNEYSCLGLDHASMIRIAYLANNTFNGEGCRIAKGMLEGRGEANEDGGAGGGK